MPRKALTTTELQDRINEVHRGRFTLLEEYKGYQVKLQVHDNVDNEDVLLTPSTLLRGGGITRNNIKYTDQQVQDIIDTRWGKGKYILKSPWINKKTRVTIHCVEHNIDFEKYLYQLQKNGTCPICTKKFAKEKRAWTNKDFTEALHTRVGDTYTLISNYIDERSEVTIRHEICGYEYTTRASNPMSGHGCPKCTHKWKITPEMFEQRFNSQANHEYTLLSKYLKSSEKVLIRHNTCGYEWWQEAQSFVGSKQGRCPRCMNKTSLGEKYLYTYFKAHNLKVDSQVMFETCRHTQTLPFDFQVNDRLLVEFQGEQHYHRVKYFNPTEESFKTAQLRDKIKYQWAKENGLPLLRIPFVEQSNLDAYLDKVLPGWLAK